MNKHDRYNMQFLMSLTDKQLKEWWVVQPEDDQLYAAELMAQALLEEFEKIAANQVIDTEKLDTTEAANYLKKYTLAS